MASQNMYIFTPRPKKKKKKSQLIVQSPGNLIEFGVVINFSGSSKGLVLCASNGRTHFSYAVSSVIE